ncbi:MAG: hypothetical protein ACP5UR_15280 [Chloroflexus sp.]|uniref:hypothetical protein n=1 Tax=Chloroflexus sp. TaxID=1904827 RepID=UPI003D1182FA
MSDRRRLARRICINRRAPVHPQRPHLSGDGSNRYRAFYRSPPAGGRERPRGPADTLSRRAAPAGGRERLPGTET